MMTKVFIATVILLVSLLPATMVITCKAPSPAPNPEWSKTFPRVINYSVNGFPVSVDGDEGRSFAQTNDGGYAIFAALDDHHYEPHTGGVDNRTTEIIKTDSSGNLQWEKGVPAVSYPYSMVQTTDSGFLLSGDQSLVKLDANGATQWSKNLGYYFTAIQASDGDYVLAGITESYLITENIANLIKTDPNGNIIWNRTYGNMGPSEAYGVVETKDGGYALAGQLAGTWLGITDAQGNLRVNITFPQFIGAFNGISNTADGGFIIVGGNSAGAINGLAQAYIVKVTSNGTTEWSHFYNNPPSTSFYFTKAVQTSEGGYIVIGPSALYRLDSSGNLLWYLSNNNDVLAVLGSTNSVAATSDGGFAVVGGKDNSVWMAKYASEPSANPSPTIILSSTPTLPPYPSPSPAPSTPAPSPTIPEFPSWLILYLLAAATVFGAILIKMRKQRGERPTSFLLYR